MRALDRWKRWSVAVRVRSTGDAYAECLFWTRRGAERFRSSIDGSRAWSAEIRRLR